MSRIVTAIPGCWADAQLLIDAFGKDAVIAAALHANAHWAFGDLVAEAHWRAVAMEIGCIAPRSGPTFH